MDKFKTIKENVEAEIVEKKSKFIASVFKITTSEEAEIIIKTVKKKYFDARHNCYAYSVIEDSKIITRFSDDGEPSGTAGAPMLNILNGNNLTNVLVIVTRYFGGILLGTGGLVKAYSDVTKKAIYSTEILEKELGYEVLFEVSYSDFEKFKYYLNQNKICTTNVEYVENVIITAEITNEKYSKIISMLEEFSFKIINYKILKDCFVSV